MSNNERSSSNRQEINASGKIIEHPDIQPSLLVDMDEESGNPISVGFQMQRNGVQYIYHIERGFSRNEVIDEKEISRTLSFEEAKSFCEAITSRFWRQHHHGSHRVAQQAVIEARKLNQNPK